MSELRQDPTLARRRKPIRQSKLFDAVVSVLGITAPEGAGQETPESADEAPLKPLKALLAEDSLVDQRHGASRLVS